MHTRTHVRGELGCIYFTAKMLYADAHMHKYIRTCTMNTDITYLDMHTQSSCPCVLHSGSNNVYIYIYIYIYYIYTYTITLTHTHTHTYTSSLRMHGSTITRSRDSARQDKIRMGGPTQKQNWHGCPEGSRDTCGLLSCAPRKSIMYAYLPCSLLV
jgi:hypothetical protein